MISRNIYKAVSVLMALVAAFTVTGLSGCKSRTVPNEVTADYDTPDDYNDERPGVTYGNVDEISYYSPTTGSERKACVYLPRDYDESQRYPVVYLLHGMSGRKQSLSYPLARKNLNYPTKPADSSKPSMMFMH